MGELPNVFQNKIEKEFQNVQDVYKSSERGSTNQNIDINKKINNIFSSSNHVYKSRVKIKTISEEREEEIVGKTNTNILTLDGKLIKISDILDIEKI